MSIATISTVGKQNTGSNTNKKINIIYIPQTQQIFPSKLMFLSDITVNNFNDFLTVLNDYVSKNGSLILIGGEYCNNSNRYVTIDIFYSTTTEIRLSYKNTATSFQTVVIADTLNPPTDWTYYNI